MNIQTKDLEDIETQLTKKFEKYQQRFQISHADLAWILLRMGTVYYLKDISSRALNEMSLAGSGRRR